MEAEAAVVPGKGQKERVVREAVTELSEEEELGESVAKTDLKLPSKKDRSEGVKLPSAPAAAAKTVMKVDDNDDDVNDFVPSEALNDGFLDDEPEPAEEVEEDEEEEEGEGEDVRVREEVDEDMLRARMLGDDGGVGGADDDDDELVLDDDTNESGKADAADKRTSEAPKLDGLDGAGFELEVPPLDAASDALASFSWGDLADTVDADLANSVAEGQIEDKEEVLDFSGASVVLDFSGVSPTAPIGKDSKQTEARGKRSSEKQPKDKSMGEKKDSGRERTRDRDRDRARDRDSRDSRDKAKDRDRDRDGKAKETTSEAVQETPKDKVALTKDKSKDKERERERDRDRARDRDSSKKASSSRLKESRSKAADQGSRGSGGSAYNWDEPKREPDLNSFYDD
jgi:hypothetical protein